MYLFVLIRQQARQVQIKYFSGFPDEVLSNCQTKLALLFGLTYLVLCWWIVSKVATAIPMVSHLHIYYFDDRVFGTWDIRAFVPLTKLEYYHEQ